MIVQPGSQRSDGNVIAAKSFADKSFADKSFTAKSTVVPPFGAVSFESEIPSTTVATDNEARTTNHFIVIAGRAGRGAAISGRGEAVSVIGRAHVGGVQFTIGGATQIDTRQFREKFRLAFTAASVAFGVANSRLLCHKPFLHRPAD